MTFQVSSEFLENFFFFGLNEGRLCKYSDHYLCNSYFPVTVDGHQKSPGSLIVHYVFLLADKLLKSTIRMNACEHETHAELPWVAPPGLFLLSCSPAPCFPAYVWHCHQGDSWENWAPGRTARAWPPSRCRLIHCKSIRSNIQPAHHPQTCEPVYLLHNYFSRRISWEVVSKALPKKKRKIIENYVYCLPFAHWQGWPYHKGD